jgi:hypothetical protein
MKLTLSFAVVTVLLTSSASAQVPAGKDADDQGEINRLLNEYKSTCAGSGSLAVFGQLINPTDGKGIDGAEVSLYRNKTGYPYISHTQGGGKYCISYPPGADITTLRFEKREASCVQQIAGNRSHYINKLFDGSCSALNATASFLGDRETRDVFGSEVAKIFKAVQITIRNNSNYQMQLTSLRLVAKEVAPTAESSTTQSKDESAVRGRQIESVAPQLVAQIASRHESGLTLLRIGPVGLITLPSRSPAGSDVRVLELDVMSHQLIPASSSQSGVVFISKSSLPQSGPAPGQSGTYATSLEVILAGNLLAVDKQVTTLGDLVGVSKANKDEKILERHSNVSDVVVSALVSVR